MVVVFMILDWIFVLMNTIPMIPSVRISEGIARYQYIKIHPKTIDLSTRLWGINPTNSAVIPQSLALMFIVLG